MINNYYKYTIGGIQLRKAKRIINNLIIKFVYIENILEPCFLKNSNDKRKLIIKLKSKSIIQVKVRTAKSNNNIAVSIKPFICYCFFLLIFLKGGQKNGKSRYKNSYNSSKFKIL